MSEQKVKPCPCCGGAALVAGSDECYVVCPDCLLVSDYYPSYEEAVKAWNNRPLEDEKDKEIARLNKLMRQKCFDCLTSATGSTWKKVTREEEENELKRDDA